MPSADSIESVLKRGAENGIDSLTASERKVWLISEAEVLCDMEGFDSFLDRYESLLPEAADAFAAAGATQIADSLRAIYAQLPARSDELLDRANALVTARTGYDYDAVSRLVANVA
jgi:hypothetical protein